MASSPAAKTDATPARTIPAITDVRRNSDSDMAFASWFVRLPDGIILQDLNDHQTELWRNTLGNTNTAIRKFDKMVLVAFDESWMVEAVVGAVDHERVTLCGIRKTDLPAASGSLYEDSTYAVRWAGDGYSVFRKADNVRMVPTSFHTPKQAEIALIGLHPKRMSA